MNRKPKKDKTPFFHDMKEHVNQTWKKKKNSSFNYPFTGKDLADLKHFSKQFQPWGVMALWDIYLEKANDWVIKNGISIFTFTRSLPWLVDDRSFKSRSREYEKALCPPLDPKIKNLTLFIQTNKPL